MDRLVIWSSDLLLGDVFFRKITKGRVRVFRSMGGFPWFIILLKIRINLYMVLLFRKYIL